MNEAPPLATPPLADPQKEKEQAFLIKFADRVKMWFRAYGDKEGNLRRPLPIIFDFDGNPHWLNRETRRNLPRRRK